MIPSLLMLIRIQQRTSQRCKTSFSVIRRQWESLAESPVNRS
jgi:hypothetical protein